MKITAHVKPNSKKGDLIVENDDKSLTVFLRATPVEGKANKELIKLIAKHYKVRKSDVAIKVGKTSKTKIIEIDM